MPAARFQPILDDVGETCKPYLGDPLAEASPCRRGNLLQLLGQKLVEQSKGGCKLELARHRDGWDCLIDYRKVKFKSSQLAFNKFGKRWEVRFRGVMSAHAGFREAAQFDDLYLLIYSPAGIHLLLHDLQTGVSSDGRRTSGLGQLIHLGGQRQEGWSTALRYIIDRLTIEGSCKLLAHVEPWDPLVQELVNSLQEESATHAGAYNGVPLSRMNPMLRGLRVQQIALVVDQMLHPHSSFHEHGVGNKPADWIRDDVRVEVKHAQMCLHKKGFRCTFRGIKSAEAGVRHKALFDELWLAIYSPLGLHMFKHDGLFGLTSAGKRTVHLGMNINVYGPNRELCYRKALVAMQQKLQTHGCEPIADVLW